MKPIFLAEHEPQLLRVISCQFAQEGYSVLVHEERFIDKTAPNGSNEKCKSITYSHLMLLDIIFILKLALKELINFLLAIMCIKFSLNS